MLRERYPQHNLYSILVTGACQWVSRKRESEREREKERKKEREKRVEREKERTWRHDETLLWHGLSQRVALEGLRVQVRLCAQQHVRHEKRRSLKHLLGQGMALLLWSLQNGVASNVLEADPERSYDRHCRSKSADAWQRFESSPTHTARFTLHT